MVLFHCVYSLCDYSVKLLKCPGRLIRYLNPPNPDEFKVTIEHSHVGDARIVGRAVEMQNLKRKALETVDSGRAVLAKLSTNMDVATAATLPNTKSMLQTVKRQRRDNDLPKIPTSLLDLEIPDEYKLVDGENFLLHDSGPGRNRVLIFSTEKNLQLLARSEAMHMDGTFDVVPPLFQQLYTLQGTTNYISLFIYSTVNGFMFI